MHQPEPANPTARRIAVVCDYALDYLGGAQTALIEQVAALTAAGADVVVVAPSPGPAAAQAGLGEGVTYVQVPARWVLPGLELPVIRNSARLRRRLAAVFTEHRTEVVQLHSEFGVAAGATSVARDLGLPVVHTVHTFFWQTSLRPQPLIAALVRAFHRGITGWRPIRADLADRAADSALRNMTLGVARRADQVVSPSAHQAERLRAAGLDRVAVVPNTVTASGPAAQALDRVEDPMRIIWIGRCEPEKRILPFVRALAAAQRRLGPGRLHGVVVGDGSQLAEASRIAGAGETDFLGRQDHDRIPELLAGAHLVALTSYGFDNQPMTIVEAVTAGRGVLYCDPALREGLAGPGIQVPVDEAEISAALVDLVEHPGRVVAASRATEQARAEFAPQTHARRMLGLYDAAIGRIRADRVPEPDAIPR
ncbi:glycosyltransferase family 4 protein [Promicromonospora panici]|uniref:glycosyltransferase family 4 protein n=1 Tax=Promicromonospora panici TaxID=2219658 RepID=UPI00101D598B|nr:glycosyltransferase [Promicromonospora panici]